jgi:hypothetical protein
VLTDASRARTAPAEEPDLGFADDFVYYVQPNLLPVMKQAGATRARINVEWALVEGEPGIYDWSDLDPVVAGMRAVGVEPHFSVQNAPQWARSAADRTEGYTQAAFPPEYDWAWKRFLRELAGRYRPWSVEIWNEPNLESFGGISPSRLAMMTVEARSAIHSITPKTRIVTGGACPCPHDPAVWHSYMRRLVQAIPGRFTVAFHPYPVIDAAHFVVAQVRDQMAFIMRIAGDHPVWITETGFSAGYLGEVRQADVYGDAYRMFRNMGVDAIYIFRLKDAPLSAYNPWTGMGAISLEDGHHVRPFVGVLRRLR